MNLHQEQNLIRAKLEREAELKKIKLLARELFALPQNAEPSDKQIQQVYKELQVLKLDSNTSFDEYNDRRAEWIDLLNDLELPLNEQDNETPLDSDYMYDIDLLQRVAGIKSMINSPEIQSYSQVANYMYLLGIDYWGHIDKIVITVAETDRSILINEVLDIFNSEDIFKSRIDKLPSSKLKDLIDAVTFKVIDPGLINSELGLNDPNTNVEANFESLFYNLELRRAQFNLNRSASKEQIENMVRLEEQALTYLQANNELNPNEVLDIKKIQRVLKEKEEYSRLATDLGLNPNVTKAVVIEELDKLGVRSYIYGVHSGAKIATLPSTDEIEKAILDKNLILEEFRQKITKDPTTPAILTQDIEDLTPIELEKRIKIVERAKKLLIDDENALMNVDNQALAQRYRELGIHGFSRLRDVNDLPVKETEAKRQGLIQAIQSKVPAFDPSGMSFKDLENRVSQISSAETIGKLATDINDYANLTNKDIRRGRKNLGFTSLGPLLPRYGRKAQYEIEPQLLALRSKALDPAEMWSTQAKKVKEAETKVGLVEAEISKSLSLPVVTRFVDLNRQKDQLEIQLQDALTRHDAVAERRVRDQIDNLNRAMAPLTQSDEVTKFNKLHEQRALLTHGVRSANMELNQAKTKAQPYKDKIEADPTIKNAKTLKKMYEEGIDPDSKVSYWQIQRKVKKELRKEEKDVRKMVRKEYKIGPLTRGLFARRRIGRINEMLEKAGKLGYKDPTQLFKAGFLNTKVLKRIEHKQKLIEEAIRYGLSPYNTTAHELNVERRIHQFRLHKFEKRVPVIGPAVVSGVRRFWRVGNRTLGTNQTIDKIDPLKGGVQRFVPRRLAKGIGAPFRAVQKIINPKRVSEGAKIGKGIFKGILEVKTQLEKGIPEKKDGK